MFPNGRATIKVAVSLGVQGSRTAPTDGLGVGIGFHFGDDVWSSLHTYLDLLAFNQRQWCAHKQYFGVLNPSG